MALNLERQLLFVCQIETLAGLPFAAFERGFTDPNLVNIAIHIVCVPLLLMTAFLFGTNTPAIPLPKVATIPYLPLNLGTGAALLYSILYILLEPVAGGLLAPLLLASTACANYATSTYGITANYWALGIHIASWLAQFVGHGTFEGRAPALLDSLVQAIFLAPFFVWFEILFYLGYRPELKARLDKLVENEVAAFKKKKEVSKGNGHVNGMPSSS